MNADAPIPCCYRLRNGQMCKEPVGHDPAHNESKAEGLRWTRAVQRQTEAGQ